MIPVFHIDKLGCDAESIASLPHTPLEYMIHFQFLANLLCIHVLSLEGKGRCAGHNPEVPNLSQSINKLLRYPVTKVFLLGVCAHIHKRKHGYRFFSLGHFNSPSLSQV